MTCLLLFATGNGVLYLVGASDPASLQRTLPPSLRITWALCLAAGGLIALAGQWWMGRPFRGAEVKRTGLIATAGGCLAYGTALVLENGWSVSAAAALPNFGFGLAFLLRAYQVHVLLREARVIAVAHDKVTAAADQLVGESRT